MRISLAIAFIFLTSVCYGGVAVYEKATGNVVAVMVGNSKSYYDTSLKSEITVADNHEVFSNVSSYRVIDNKLILKPQEEIDAIKKEKEFNENFSYFESLEKESAILDSIIAGTTVQKIIDKANIKKAENAVKVKEVKDKLMTDKLAEIK